MKPTPHDLTLAQQLRRTFVALGAIVGVALTAIASTYAVSALWLTPELERSHSRTTRTQPVDMPLGAAYRGMLASTLTR